MEQQSINNADVNEMVRQNASIIQEVAEETLGRSTRNQSSTWFDKECKIAVEIGANTRIKVAAYKRKKILVYRLLRRKKREHPKKQIKTLEAQNRNGNVRDFYKITKNQRKGFQHENLKINDIQVDNY